MKLIETKPLGIFISALFGMIPVSSFANIKTFTTADLNKKRNIVNENYHITRSGSPVQTIGTQFIAASIPDVDVLLRAQPNGNGFVGPTQYLLNTNQTIRTFNKLTGQPDGIIDIDSATFLGSPIADARCTFDRWGQRWLVLGSTVNYNLPISQQEPAITLAWSDGPIITPQTKWSLRIFTNAEVCVPETPPSGVDSPNLATDQNAVYINMDVFENSGSPVFGGFYQTSVVIPQSSFIAGNPFTFTTFKGLFNAIEFPVTFGYSQAPSPNNYDPNPQFGYMIVATNGEVFPGVINTSFAMYRILNSGSNSPTLFPAPPTIAQPIPTTPPIAVPATPNYADASFVPHKGNLYGNALTGQNGPLQNFTSLDVGGIHIRNHQLFLVTQSQVDSTGAANVNGDRSAIVWYQYDLTGGGVETESTVPTLVQSGTIYDPTITNTPLFYFEPSIMTNKNGDMVIIGNVAGANSFVQSFYVGRKASDPLGELRDISLFTPLNTNAYNFGTLFNSDPLGQRWGDYSSLAPDPTNDLDMWATLQIVSGPNLWALQATQLVPA